jgi:actin-related protein 2
MAKRDSQIVCLEINDASISAGLVFAPIPTCKFPAIVGRLLKTEARPGLTLSSQQTLFVGDQCRDSEIRHLLEINHPVQMGIVRSWEDMLHLFDYTFQRLGIDPRAVDYSIALSYSYSLSSRKDLPKIVQTMFERYAFSSVMVVNDAVACLYDTGLLTGLVVDVGESFTHITPVYEGTVLSKFAKCINLAGRNVTECA